MEMYGFEFASLYNADVRAGNLRDRYDVILIADMSPSTILEGYRRGSVPPRFAGGIGNEGVLALDAFVRAGGTLVALNGSTAFAIDAFHLPVENVVGGVERDEFFMSGSLLRMIVDPRHPVVAGMPDRPDVFVARSPVFTVRDGFEGSVFAKYDDDGTPLRSGYLLGEEHLQGYASGVDVRHGEGHVILFGMRPQWRGQPFGNFGFLFNAVLYTKALGDSATPTEEFWSAPDSEGETTEPAAR